MGEKRAIYAFQERENARPNTAYYPSPRVFEYSSLSPPPEANEWCTQVKQGKLARRGSVFLRLWVPGIEDRFERGYSGGGAQTNASNPGPTGHEVLGQREQYFGLLSFGNLGIGIWK